MLEGNAYLWVKALHVIAVIAWMAGLLYLPRLFVYHTATTRGSQASETFKVMERRLLRAIMNPAMITTWVFGLWLYISYGDFSDIWLHLKLALVIAMTVAHGLMARWRKDFEADRNERPDMFYRIANEVPTVLMIIIVILVIVKPF
ncbi:MAG: protoporphyrinogen oxidase HemJ [Rhodospirillaceae bacterium]|nr:protoporphyrinogen oxidase HemJ [Rhodospirillaceae bacterium]